MRTIKKLLNIHVLMLSTKRRTGDKKSDIEKHAMPCLNNFPLPLPLIWLMLRFFMLFVRIRLHSQLKNGSQQCCTPFN